MAKQTIHHVDQLMEDVSFIATLVRGLNVSPTAQPKLEAIAKRWEGAVAKGVASNEAYMMEAANTAPAPVPDAPKQQPAHAPAQQRTADRAFDRAEDKAQGQGTPHRR